MRDTHVRDHHRPDRRPGHPPGAGLGEPVRRGPVQVRQDPVGPQRRRALRTEHVVLLECLHEHERPVVDPPRPGTSRLPPSSGLHRLRSVRRQLGSRHARVHRGLLANQAATEDVEAIFATGGARKCRCQALKVPGWIWRDSTQEERDIALLEQTACGTAGPTSGLIGYVDGEAAGWVAVEPRRTTPGCGAGSRRGCGWTPKGGPEIRDACQAAAIQTGRRRDSR